MCKVGIGCPSRGLMSITVHGGRANAAVLTPCTPERASSPSTGLLGSPPSTSTLLRLPDPARPV